MRSTGLPRRRGDRRPEILRRRVAVGVRLQVRVDAFPERLGADVALDHAQHRRALLVGDGVERFVDLAGRLDAGVNRARRLQRIEVERRLVLERFVDRDVPFGLPRGQRTVRHPGREPFVQPEVVPPLHRHQIAEPLVRHLVRDRPTRCSCAWRPTRVALSASRSVSR